MGQLTLTQSIEKNVWSVIYIYSGSNLVSGPTNDAANLSDTLILTGAPAVTEPVTSSTISSSLCSVLVSVNSMNPLAAAHVPISSDKLMTF